MNRLALVAVTFGALFGFVLSWAGMTDADVIRDMLLLKSLDLYLLMGAAVAVGFIGVRVLRVLKVKTLLDGREVAVESARPTRNTIIGSVIFGLGWSIACTCPGPVAAQLGAGQVLALAVTAGILVGVFARGATGAVAVKA